MEEAMRNRSSLYIATACAIIAGCTDSPHPVAVPLDTRDASLIVAPDPASVLTLIAPVFGLSTNPDGSLLAGALPGITELRKGSTTLIAPLQGVSGVESIGGGSLFAITGEPGDPSAEGTSRRLFRVSQGNVRQIADLGAFEATVNPDQFWNDDAPNSNPFGLAALSGGSVLVSDAGANTILVVDAKGAIDWVAVLTPQQVSTSNFKELVGCTEDPSAPPCELPATITAQPVATSITIGPDGDYYAGELTGFPSAPGMSRVWRIRAGSRHVQCPSTACTLVASGFTSIVDLTFGPDGRLYVVELDAAGWLAVEILSGGFPISPVAGGRVQSCDVGSGQCVVRAAGLALPAAITVGRDGRIWIAENESIPFGVARVHVLP
jgi:hypothetical protein